MSRSWILTGSPENHAATRTHAVPEHQTGSRRAGAADGGGAAAGAQDGHRCGRGRMSAPGRGASGAQRLGSASNRVVGVWRGLPPERRLAAIAAVGLFLTLFLPWYQETVIASGVKHLQSVSASLTGWGAFSFVEAAVLLVAAGVLMLLFVRAEGNAFHVPGGDGGVITAAGVWTCVLIVWRMFDKEGTTGHGQYATTSGIEWGIFVALGVAALLAYAGTRIRLAHEPEPPLPGDRDPGPADGRGRPDGRPLAQAAADSHVSAAAAARGEPSAGPRWAPMKRGPSLPHRAVAARARCRHPGARAHRTCRPPPRRHAGFGPAASALRSRARRPRARRATACGRRERRAAVRGAGDPPPGGAERSAAAGAGGADATPARDRDGPAGAAALTRVRSGSLTSPSRPRPGSAAPAGRAERPATPTIS